MAKIRGFKPDLWTDEDFVDVTAYARLLWMGMWSYACDNGHLADKSKQIKMRVLPTDDINCAELLRELEGQGLIERADGWITIPNLTRHQKPDRRYFVSCEKQGCEPPAETILHRAARRANTVHTPEHTGSTSGAHVDGDGEVMVKGSDGETSAATTSPKKTANRKRPATRLPDDWKPTEKHWEKRNDGIDVEREAAKFRLHAEANDRTQANWNASFSQWLLNARPAPRVSQPRNLQNAHEIVRPPDGLSPDEYAQWEYEQRQKRGRA